jgi:hypothetical protein
LLSYAAKANFHWDIKPVSQIRDFQLRLEDISDIMITRKGIWRLIIDLMTYLNRDGGQKIDSCNDSSHYPVPGVTAASVKRLICSRISQNKALDTATSAI